MRFRLFGKRLSCNGETRAALATMRIDLESCRPAARSEPTGLHAQGGVRRPRVCRSAGVPADQMSEQVAEFMSHWVWRRPGDRGVPVIGVAMSVAVSIVAQAPTIGTDGAVWS